MLNRVSVLFPRQELAFLTTIKTVVVPVSQGVETKLNRMLTMDSKIFKRWAISLFNRAALS